MKKNYNFPSDISIRDRYFCYFIEKSNYCSYYC